MKNNIIFLILIYLFVLRVNGQNMVLNGSFELQESDSCPDAPSQIYLANNWITASNGNPDLYNICSTYDDCRIPMDNGNQRSYQWPKSGNGFAGIFVYRNFGDFIYEYMESKLLRPLEKKNIYYIEFFVSPGMRFQYFYTDAIGLAFSETLYYKELAKEEVLSLDPVVENRGMVIKDTMGWTKISGCYVANGGEEYLIIGNFRTLDETIVENHGPYESYNNYMYIDDVSIRCFNPLPDTILLCEGETVEYNAAFDGSEGYLWSTGVTDSVFEIDHSGLYSVDVFMESCILSDSVVVIYMNENEHIFKDTTICDGISYEIATKIPGEYEWSDGSFGKSLDIIESGDYFLTITNECGIFDYDVTIDVVNCSCNVYIPEIFTPNNDGVNDYCEPYFDCDFEYSILQFSIFDRWGGKIYSRLDKNDVRWDGNTRGKVLENGIFTWFLEYEYFQNGEIIRRLEKGNVTLIR